MVDIWQDISRVVLCESVGRHALVIVREEDVCHNGGVNACSSWAPVLHHGDRENRVEL